MPKQRVIYLIKGYWERSLNKEELAELSAFITQDAAGTLVEEVLAELGMQLDEIPAYDEKRFNPALEAVLKVDKKTEQFTIRRRVWIAAASIIVLLGLGLCFYFMNMKPRIIADVAKLTKDIPAPATSKAIITLADGSNVFLDSIGNGQLAQLGNIKLVKLANGEIAYQTAAGQVLKEPQYNTLTNPRGSKVIAIQLSDGSRVWLNTGSSITYPVAFAGNERKVELRGEGYFEIAKDKTRKFIVSSNGVTTEVLGTHFNVNAYNNEAAIKVTLLEGSVRTKNDKGAVVIRPGQQAVAGNGSIKLNNAPDLDQVMAWKNGYFSFDGLTLKQAMTQLERWYDIDVVYEGGVQNIELTGKMTRDVTLNGLMVILQKLGVHCSLEGRKLIIKP